MLRTSNVLWALLGVFVSLGLLLAPNTATAGCTLGVKDCRNGYWYVCQTCGSETCMIMTANKCYRVDPPKFEGDVTLDSSPSAPVTGGLGPDLTMRNQSVVPGSQDPIVLACTQLPTSCSSNSDCTCSNCCGDLAGIGVCQPNC